METRTIRRGVGRAATVALLAGLVGACADQSNPAPVFIRGEAAIAPALQPPPSRQITVRSGQTLQGVARVYHVPPAAIIAANGLRPPYALRPGARLIIPGAWPPARQATGYTAPAPIVASPVPLPPPHPESLPVPPPRQAANPLSQPGVTTPPSAAQALPDVIPLDGPPPPKQAAAVTAPVSPRPVATLPQTAAAASAAPAPVMPPRNAVAALPLPGDAAVDWNSADAAQGGAAGNFAGRFPWPVRGRILASYGNAPGGGHNDGINIAAPRGTPVRAIDGGTVAYAGNEVKGYGNLVLIKHANGWISAYAHLDGLSVKLGETIAAGQVIAKVGDSGGVSEPQLHFELRRGKRPVDPKEFLAPAPSAAGPMGDKAG